jgi:NADPH-dependent 2,4-dienoyl-CoA reductase/sulfur reductase-like enzyme
LTQDVKYLLIGGGVASVAAAQAIRERDKDGSMMLVTADANMPYDRPPLSKNFLSNLEMTADDAASKFDNFYPDNNIQLKRSTLATSVNLAKHAVTLEDGSIINYEKLLLATGSRPKHLSDELSNQENVFVLRTIEHAEAIRNRAKEAKSAVVVGTGFIGLEVAAQFASMGIQTTIVSRDAYPWKKFASPVVGEFLRSYFEAKGVQMLLSNEVTAIAGGSVVTGSNTRHEADMVVLGLGVDLNLDLAQSAGLQGVRQNGVEVNELLQSSDPDVFVAGDIALFKDLAMERIWHLEHHLNARWQGQTVGANMAGAAIAYDKIPYFFSDFFDLHMVLRGDPESGSLTTMFGNLEAGDFVELYHDDGGVVRMAIAFSKDEKKLDATADKLEEIIRAKTRTSDLTSLHFV